MVRVDAARPRRAAARCRGRLSARGRTGARCTRAAVPPSLAPARSSRVGRRTATHPGTRSGRSASPRVPIALLEVGASAGLGLQPDRYRYRFRTTAGDLELPAREGPGDVVLDCDWSGGASPPAAVPQIVWRTGIDLAPVDVRDDDAVRWLETLIRPEQQERRARLQGAVEIARHDPPRIVRGDAVELLQEVASQAPPGARLAVARSATLAYLAPDARKAFVEAVGRLDATWISSEAPAVLPDVTARLPPGVDVRRDLVVARDGQPIGSAGPHGQRFRAFSGDPHRLWSRWRS